MVTVVEAWPEPAVVLVETEPWVLFTLVEPLKLPAPSPVTLALRLLSTVAEPCTPLAWALELLLMVVEPSAFWVAVVLPTREAEPETPVDVVSVPPACVLTVVVPPDCVTLPFAAPAPVAVLPLGPCTVPPPAAAAVVVSPKVRTPAAPAPLA